MLRHIAAILTLFALFLSAAWAQPAPVNPHASAEARALLGYLYSISGRYTLSGQHNYPLTIANWTNRAYDFTGKYPAVFGQDFGFQGGEDKDSVLARPALVEEAKRQYRNGAVVTFTWHAVRPTDDEPVTFRDSVQGKLTDFEWRELLTPGTALYKRWCAQVDVIAGYLRQLRDERVPVLWRPYHEVNGSWFWWGGRKGKDGSAALYRQLYDRMVNHHRLDNLVWVWNANAPGSGGSGPGPYVDYYPGAEYADVLSVDVYGDFKQSHYDDLVALAAGRPVALGEVGGMPSPAVLKEQSKFTWWMTWSEFVEEANPLEAVRALYNAPMTLNRDDPKLAGPMAAIRKASAAPDPEPVTPEASKGAKEMLAALYRTTGQGILSGQDNGEAAGAPATQKIFELTAKRPAIFGQELGVAKDAAAAAVEEAKRQHKNHAMVSLSWRAPRPTDGGPADGKLSDFEWTELLTPGTHLHQRWCDQVDAVAGYLKQLQDSSVPVLWRPYPQSNGARSWWAGRKGIDGSAALYRMLFERLVGHHKLRNLVWVWSAAAPGFGPGTPGLYHDYFPGLTCVDALSVDIDNPRSGFRRDVELSRFGVGKVVGLGVSGWAPAGPMLDEPSRFAWFLAAADEPAAADRAEAWKKVYGSPRVATAQ